MSYLPFLEFVTKVSNSGMFTITSKPTSCSCSFILFATSFISLKEAPNLISLSFFFA
ncbi:hypothetical protein ACMBCQ_00330 [Candidatus Phytoplasma citri]